MGVVSRTAQPSARPIRVLVTLAAAAALLAACGGSSSDVARPGADGSSSAQAVVKKCRDVSGHRIANGEIEREPLVPCSERHNVEIVGTWPLYGGATRAAIEQYAAHCFEDEEDTLGIRSAQVYRTQVVAVGVPISPGHVRVQCEAWLLPGIGDYRDGPAAMTSTSLVDQAKRGDHAGTTWCTNEVPTASGSHFVDCSKPHLAQAMKNSLFFRAGDGLVYPASAIKERGQDMCRAQLGHLQDSSRLTSYAWWWPKAIWEENGRPRDIPGACWYFRTDHRDLPAIG